MASRTTQLALTAALTCASVLTLAGASPQGEFAQAQRANQSALREYAWKSRTELKLDGESKATTLDLVRHDIDGRLQKTRIGGSADEQVAKPTAPLGRGGLIQNRIVARKKGQFEELVRGLGALAGSYAELPHDRLEAFTKDAAMSQGEGALTGTIRIHGRNVLSTGDAMTVWIDPRTFMIRRVEIATALKGKPVDVASDYRTLDNGVTYQARSLVRYPDKELELMVETFDYEHVGPAR